MVLSLCSRAAEIHCAKDPADTFFTTAFLYQKLQLRVRIKWASFRVFISLDQKACQLVIPQDLRHCVVGAA